MKLQLLVILLSCSFLSKAQSSGGAYAYYTAFGNTSGTDFYVFTAPKAFNYPKGASYVFAPVAYETLAKKSITASVKDIDPLWKGLYANQVIENVSLAGQEVVNNEIQKKMQELYQTNRRQPNRTNAVKILLVDSETGRVLAEKLLDATPGSKSKSGAGNAN